MKIRNWFVSNSSSSSFICEICNHTESGWDACPTELGFVTCINEHIICEEHLLNGETVRDEYDEEDVASEKACPICQFEMYSKPQLAKYLQKIYNVNRDKVFAEIKKINKRRKKLYDFEYIEYVFRLHNLNDDMVLEKLRNEYKTYSDFVNFIYGRD